MQGATRKAAVQAATASRVAQGAATEAAECAAPEVLQFFRERRAAAQAEGIIGAETMSVAQLVAAVARFKSLLVPLVAVLVETPPSWLASARQIVAVIWM